MLHQVKVGLIYSPVCVQFVTKDKNLTSQFEKTGEAGLTPDG